MLDKIKEAVKLKNIKYRDHALERMMQRSILRSEVQKAILEGKIIEKYNDDFPFPSVLIAYIKTSKPLHIVLSYDDVNNICYIITAYIPNTNHFEDDLITRKKDEY
jgi:hypothetical protein